MYFTLVYIYFNMYNIFLNYHVFLSIIFVLVLLILLKRTLTFKYKKTVLFLFVFVQFFWNTSFEKILIFDAMYTKILLECESTSAHTMYDIISYLL